MRRDTLFGISVVMDYHCIEYSSLEKKVTTWKMRKNDYFLNEMNYFFFSKVILYVKISKNV